MPISPPTCRLCSEHHWSHEPHKYPKTLQVRPSIVDLSVTSLSETVVSVTGVYDSGDEPDRSCIECGAAFKGQRSTAKFCSAKCRVRASRRK